VSVPARPMPKPAAAVVTVPGLTGARAGDAEARMRSLGLSPKVVHSKSTLRAGLVVKSDPPAGSEVNKGSIIALFVSRGPSIASTSSGTSTGSGSGGSSGSTPAAGHCGPGMYTRPNGTCAPIPASNGGAPPANSPEGHNALRNNPDCQNAPPPPPGYTGPVQC
jgi:hypothetical protein